jgi:hypothetical protein
MTCHPDLTCHPGRSEGPAFCRAADPHRNHQALRISWLTRCLTTFIQPPKAATFISPARRRWECRANNRKSPAGATSRSLNVAKCARHLGTRMKSEASSRPDAPSPSRTPANTPRYIPRHRPRELNTAPTLPRARRQPDQPAHRAFLSCEPRAPSLSARS